MWEYNLLTGFQAEILDAPYRWYRVTFLAAPPGEIRQILQSAARYAQIPIAIFGNC